MNCSQPLHPATAPQAAAPGKNWEFSWRENLSAVPSSSSVAPGVTLGIEPTALVIVVVGTSAEKMPPWPSPPTPPSPGAGAWGSEPREPWEPEPGGGPSWTPRAARPGAHATRCHVGDG